MEKLLIISIIQFLERRSDGMHKIECWLLTDHLCDKFQMLIKTFNDFFNRELSGYDNNQNKMNNDVLCLNLLRLLSLVNYIVECHPEEFLIDVRLSVLFVDRLLKYLAKLGIIYSTYPNLKVTQAQDIKQELLWETFMIGNSLDNKQVALNGGVFGGCIRLLNSILT